MKSSWSENSLEKAIETIQEKKMSLRRAALEFQIPRATLSEWKRNLRKYKGKGIHKIVLTENEEKEVLNWINKMQEIGICVGKQVLFEKIAEIRQLRIGKKIYPGKRWWLKVPGVTFSLRGGKCEIIDDIASHLIDQQHLIKRDSQKNERISIT